VNGRVWRRFDWTLVLLAIALICIGIAMIRSATSHFTAPGVLIGDSPTIRQIIYAVGGMVLLFAIAAINYRIWKDFQYVIYASTLIILGLLFIIGHTSFGARSWLRPDSVQPSELTKIFLILVLAKQLGLEDERELDHFRHVLGSFLLVAPVILLIYLQPDLGTAVIVAAIWLGMVFAAGVRLRHLAIFGITGAATVPAIWLSLEDYMKARIIHFFNPQSDPSGASYNVIQALIGIGSGGLWGKGYGHGTQSQLHFLRVRHTDFIFSVLAEEMGFLGCIVLLLFIALLLFRIMKIAEASQDAFGRLIAVGVASMIFAQSFINLAMNLNLLPVTGLPLPLISYGGSSLITTLIGLGLVESVSMRRKKLDFGE